MKPTRILTGLAAAGLAAAVALPSLTNIVSAADHLEAPKTQANQLADITDVYAWHTNDGKVVAVINFAGFNEAGQPAKYDASVVYGFHIDNDGDNVADIDTWVRFGQNDAGEWGVQVVGLPGGAATVEGPVETVLTTDLGLRVWAGLRDDPFFFDLDGFQTTLMTGTVSFDSKNDSFRMVNVTSIVVEMSADALMGAGTSFRLWATTRA